LLPTDPRSQVKRKPGPRGFSSAKDSQSTRGRFSNRGDQKMKSTYGGGGWGGGGGGGGWGVGGCPRERPAGCKKIFSNIRRRAGTGRSPLNRYHNQSQSPRTTRERGCEMAGERAFSRPKVSRCYPRKLLTRRLSK